MAIKWGVIGAGGIADRRTIPEGIAKAPNAKLVAVMDIDAVKAKAVAEKYKVKYYTDEKDLLSDNEVEAVYIATPTYLHCSQASLAAEKGKHILCEKPMAITLGEARQIIDVCKKNKVNFSLGYMMRFHAHHQKIKELIKQGLLGQLVMARAQLSCWYPPIEGAWRQDPELGGGGALIDMGSHCIDLLEMFIGRVKEVSCFVGNLTHKYPVEDTANVLLKFENGAQGAVDNCFNIPDASAKNILEIYGTKGSILAKGTIGQMPGGEAMVYLEGDGKKYNAQQQRVIADGEKIEVEPVNMYKAEIEHFSDCIENNKAPAITPEEWLHNLEICLAAYESAKTGKAVKIK
ncbi:MAG: Gfo/Idh/MocA family oxidoreductase [Elusimicrobia bacterium]|nr:Gfo/Idh/MocA family oxidoreductase [Elusimicrobiota bacterium]MBU2614447.1 Gfo/Idh/MocA family oxidoreductase [Elusimicrobiota bacterium]